MFSLKYLLIDPNGRFVIAKIKLGNQERFLTSVYAPCDSQHQTFFSQNLCTNIVSKANTSKIIIAGDWNTALYSIDKHGGRPWHEKDPIKFLGTYLSHDTAGNNNNNFYIKIRKMETKLNIWLSRNLTLFGRTMLAKSLGLSQLIYTASMLSVPETAIQRAEPTQIICLLVEE